jgi:hypothetical protein
LLHRTSLLYPNRTTKAAGPSYRTQAGRVRTFALVADKPAPV